MMTHLLGHYRLMSLEKEKIYQHHSLVFLIPSFCVTQWYEDEVVQLSELLTELGIFLEDHSAFL